MTTMPTTKKPRPSVSVIIPVYNNVKELKKCLDSLNAQAYKNLEIIIVDNNSSEDVAKEVSAYWNVRRVSEEKIGIHVARNKGIA